MRICRKKSQGIVEHVLLTAAVVMGVIVMSVYVSRSKKGYMKKNSDALGTQYSMREQRVNKLKHVQYVATEGGDEESEALFITKGKNVTNLGYKRTEFKKHMVSVTTDGSVGVTTTGGSDFFGDGTVDSVIQNSLGNFVTDINIQDGVNVIEETSDKKLSEEKLMDQL